MAIKEEAPVANNKEEKPVLIQPITPEEIQALLKDAIQTDASGKFTRVVLNQGVFAKIRERLIATIQSMEKNPSMISRLAELWGQLPLWQKILGGVTLTVPTLVLGLIANIGFLLAICGVTTIIYTGGGIILDDHHKCSHSVVDSLTQGVLGLADLLELVITTLDKIAQGLADEVEQFKQENARLTDNVGQLTNKLQTLDVEIKNASTAVAALQQTKDELEKTAHTLGSKVEEQTSLLDENQQELKRVTAAYRESERTLSEKVAEFAKVKTELTEEVEKVRAVGATMQEAAFAVSQLTLSSEEDRAIFRNKLDEILTNKGANFDSIATRLQESEAKLAIVRMEFNKSNQLYKTLNEQQMRQIADLKEVIREQRQQRPLRVMSDVLRQFGHFAQEEKAAEPSSGPIAITLDH